MARQSFFAGETVDFSFTFSAYPASGGWTGKVILTCGTARHVVDLAASGDSLAARVAAATSAEWGEGIYKLVVMVSHTDGRSYVANEGEVAIRQNPGAETPTLSPLEQQLVKVDEAITAIAAGGGVQSYTIQTAVGSRQIQRMSLEDLRKHRAWLVAKIEADRAALGESPKRSRFVQIGVAFRG